MHKHFCFSTNYYSCVRMKLSTKESLDMDMYVVGMSACGQTHMAWRVPPYGQPEKSKFTHKKTHSKSYVCVGPLPGPRSPPLSSPQLGRGGLLLSDQEGPSRRPRRHLSGQGTPSRPRRPHRKPNQEGPPRRSKGALCQAKGDPSQAKKAPVRSRGPPVWPKGAPVRPRGPVSGQGGPP